MTGVTMSEMEEVEEAELKDTTIKGLNTALYTELRAEAVRKGITVGEAINQAMISWLRRGNLKELTRRKIMILSKLEDVVTEIGPLDKEIASRLREEYLEMLEQTNDEIARATSES